MRALQKFFSGLLIWALVLPALPVFADGGSNMSYQVMGKQTSVKPGETVKTGLLLNIKTNFPKEVAKIRFENLQLACYGDDLFSEVELRTKKLTIATANFTPDGKVYKANFNGKDFVMKGSGNHNFEFDFKVKDGLQAPAVTHCTIMPVTFANADNNQLINAAEVDILPDQNDSSMFTLGTKKQLDTVTHPFTLVSMSSRDDVQKYLGSGFATVEFVKKNDGSLTKLGDDYVVNLKNTGTGFDEILSFMGSNGSLKLPALLQLKINDREVAKLQKEAGTGNEVKIKIRDFNLFGQKIGTMDPIGVATYVK